MNFFGDFFNLLWDEIVMRPIINGLAILYDLLFDEFVLAILVFTLLMRLLLLPLTLRQTNQMRKMQGIQPRIRALQNKYTQKTPENRKRLSQETMQVYKEAGVNPIGCLGPFIIQLPIWIGLYRAILSVVPTTPESLVELSRTFYFWNPSALKAPFDPYFLGIDLAAFTQVAPIPLSVLLPVLVGITTWLQQKVSTPVSTDARQQQTSQLMLWMMPAMLGVFSWTFPAGLAIYIFFSNLIGVILQYFAGGRQPIMFFGRMLLGTEKTRAELQKTLNERNTPTKSTDTTDKAIESTNTTENNTNGNDPAVYGKNRRRSNRNRTTSIRSRTRRR